MDLRSILRAVWGDHGQHAKPRPKFVNPLNVPIYEFDSLEPRIVFGNMIGGFAYPGTPIPTAPYADTSGGGEDGTDDTTNDNHNRCCGDSPVIDMGSSGMGDAGRTSEPIRLFDGMPIISHTDLEMNVLGIQWGVDRTWTGLDNSSPFGNGWTVSELPYLVVAGNSGASGVAPTPAPSPDFFSGDINDGGYDGVRVSLVQGGSNFNFTVAAGQPRSISITAR